MEIVELILVACEAKVLALSVPRVSKLFKNLSGDNSGVWKAKCDQKYSSWNSKPSDQTWKRYYFTSKLQYLLYIYFSNFPSRKHQFLDLAKSVFFKLLFRMVCSITTI